MSRQRPPPPASVAAGMLVTPHALNDYPRWSAEIQDAWDREHSPADQEHEDLRIPIAAGIIEMAAGVYSVGASKNIASVAKNATGDITITFDVDAQLVDEYAVIATPILATEPFIVKEYDDGATRAAVGCKTRLLICDQSAVAKNCALFVQLFGRRSGSGTAAGVAVGDVRQRIAVDGPESAEHRELLREYAAAWTSAFERKHEHAKRGFGSHFDLMVPAAIALMTAPPNPYFDLGPGETVWSSGFDSLRWGSGYYDFASGTSLTQRLDFEIEDQRAVRMQSNGVFAFLGSHATVTQDVATLKRDGSVLPRWKRVRSSSPGVNTPRRMRSGALEFGYGDADTTRVVIAIYGYPTRRVM